MANDLVHLAMERAAKNFDRTGGKGIFNAAGFACEFSKLAESRPPVDGRMVRAMLTGRDDVTPLKGGAHYQLLWGCRA